MKSASPHNSARPPRQPGQSLAAQAHAAIKHRILTLGYAPGEFLNEMRICDELLIGRTPVHQAIQLLAEEGLVDIKPRKGVMVRPVSLDEVAQIIEARLVIEPYCAALAARRVTQADLEEPRGILATAQQEIDAANGVEELMQLDRQFHAWIAQTGGNRVLGEVIGKLQDRALRFWFISLSSPDHLAQVQAEHLAILQAIAARDENRASEATRQHILSFRETILRVAL